jgi:hypothetical protein
MPFDPEGLCDGDLHVNNGHRSILEYRGVVRSNAGFGDESLAGTAQPRIPNCCDECPENR